MIKMKATSYIFFGTLLALLLISFAAGNEPTQGEIKSDEQANHVGDQKYYGGGGWGGPGGGGGWGGYGGGGGWGGRGGGWGGGGPGGAGGWGGGGPGGGGWGGGGPGGGGWGGGGCRWGCCGSRGYYGGGGCRCCYNAQEALAYMQNEAKP